MQYIYIYVLSVNYHHGSMNQAARNRRKSIRLLYSWNQRAESWRFRCREGHATSILERGGSVNCLTRCAGPSALQVRGDVTGDTVKDLGSHDEPRLQAIDGGQATHPCALSSRVRTRAHARAVDGQGARACTSGLLKWRASITGGSRIRASRPTGDAAEGSMGP